jgi:hypothetical protein
MTQRVKVAFLLAVAAALGAAVVMSACESVPLTAAPGTTMTLDAHPNFVMANGGTSVVTAILVEPAGTFVPDGTEVFFFTTLGRVDASGKSVNGVVRVNFVSDSRSGRATVSAFSGGPAPEPSATPTASPTPNPTPTPAGLLDVQASDGSSAGAHDFEATTGQNSATVEITVGNVLANRVQAAANPPLLANNRSTTIVATVFDQSGNPIQNVPVYFSLGTGATAAESMESGGAPRFTDSNGQAFDTFRTRAPYDPNVLSSQRTVLVNATTANGISATPVTVTVTVNVTH